MAPISSSTFHDHERLDFESIQALLISVNKQILILLNDEEARKSLQLKCISKLKFQTQKFFEFSEQCVLSNLYWGIENVEASIQVKFLEERASRLKDSERMLQVSALIDENGSTAGIPNRFLICCSYFYLSLVRKLQRDEWQVTLYFLQALLVYPRLVRMEFAPEICGSLFLSQIMVGSQNTSGTRGSSPQYLFDFCEDGTDEAMWQLARRYKDWLIYYQVMLYGETRQGHWGCGVASSIDEESPSLKYQKSIRNRYLSSVKLGNGWLISQNFDTMHPLDPDESIMDKVADWPKAFMVNQKQKHVILEAINMDDVCIGYQKERVGIKCLQDMIQEPESDNPASVYLENHSEEGSDLEATEDSGNSVSVLMTNADELKPEFDDRQLQAPCSISIPEYVEETPFNSPGLPIHKEAQEMETDSFCSRRFLGPKIDPNLSIVELGDINSNKFCQCCTGEEAIRRSQCGFRLIDYLSSSSVKNFIFEMDHQRGSAREKFNSLSLSEEGLHPESETILILEIFENAIATLCFSEGLLKCEENEKLEVSNMWEMVNNKEGAKYSLLKDIILGQLTDAITNSKDDKVIRSSVSILSAMIIENRSIIEDAMKKGLCLSDLATALKRNVHEAAILIYLINPSPTEIISLELLPKLLDIICNSSSDKERTASSLLLTPPAASLMIIKVLVTSFDYSTNVKHLDAISSPKVLSRLVNVAINGHQEEFASLAAILTKCMQLNGKCRKFLSKFIPLAPFILLLRSEEKCAKFIAIEFFHEFLHMPRTSAINILHQIRQQGSINIMSALISCIHQSQQVYQILAANLLLQLDMLEDSCGESTYREEAIDVLLKSIASSKSSATQILSASIVSNLGGTYSWTGEPYTTAWLLKRACLTSIYHRNMVRNFDWLEESLQDDGIGAWCRKIARGIIGVGTSVFYALEKGLKSKIKSVSRDCLTTIAWLGYEIAMSPSNLRYSACEILLTGIEQFLHPGLELDERFLACLCVYSYASGKGMQKLIHFSEGVRESLRRLSNITWMAGELLNVADYILPNKSQRVSCVHTQILEANQNRSGAACALIFYKGQLYSGYSDGSIKAWDIKGQAFSLVWDIKEHKKAVTCFALYEPGDSLLSGSTDKTIRVWRMVLGKLECVEVIEANETIHKIDTIGKMILVVAQSRGIKVFDASREVKVICRDKHVKCTTVVQRKIYVGCTDSSIQEIDITRNREREIRSPSRSWRMCCRPINSVIVYKDWVYVASSIIEGSSLKDWRRFNKPQMSLTTGKGKNVLEMGVVEDFIYLNCSSLPGILQIWLRGTQRKVGRLSAGSRITSILTANDIVFCGTEMGLIKGWIPL